MITNKKSMLLTMSVGFLVGLTTPNATICNDNERYGFNQNVSKKDFGSAIKKGNTKQLIHHLSRAYPAPQPGKSYNLNQQKISKELNDLLQQTKTRSSELSNRQTSLEQKKLFPFTQKLFTIDPKSIKKSKNHAAWGATFFAGSAVVASLILFIDHYSDPHGIYPNLGGPGLGVGIGLLAGAYKLLYKAPRHLLQAFVSPKKRIEEKLDCNKVIINAIEKTEKKLGFSRSE